MKTRLSILIVFLAVLTAFVSLIASSPALSQEKQADNMQILLDKIKADKKLVVAANMDLMESEAKGFWPVYGQYQKDLEAINQRIGKLIGSYAEDYRNATLTDEKAQKLTTELITIQNDEAALQAAYVPKLNKVLPAKKVARYLQIENKIRAAIKYELASNIPLVE